MIQQNMVKIKKLRLEGTNYMKKRYSIKKGLEIRFGEKGHNGPLPNLTGRMAEILTLVHFFMFVRSKVQLDLNNIFYPLFSLAKGQLILLVYENNAIENDFIQTDLLFITQQLHLELVFKII